MPATKCVCGVGGHQTDYCIVSLKALGSDIDDYRYGYCPKTGSVEVAELYKQLVTSSDNGDGGDDSYINLELYEMIDTDNDNDSGVVNGGGKLVTTSVYNFANKSVKERQNFRLEIRPNCVYITLTLAALRGQSSEHYPYYIYPKCTPTVGHLKRLLAKEYSFVAKTVTMYLTEKGSTLPDHQYTEYELLDEMPISKAWIYDRFANSLIQVIPNTFTNRSEFNCSDIITEKFADLSTALSNFANQLNQSLATVGCGHKCLTDASVYNSDIDGDQCDGNPSISKLKDNKTTFKQSVRRENKSKLKNFSLNKNDMNTNCLLNDLKVVLQCTLDPNDQLIRQFGKLEELVDSKDVEIGNLKALIKDQEQVIEDLGNIFVKYNKDEE
ncbi:uncharacterized protein LOC128963156 [Oppia nitens]|uniref:uncharacterized protein LOC128963156 n=1 Tax=Oppia nitens TaxID=1686743 RepID=UPI0023DBBC2B|nr:uncharacterized protein LOC128963156 [Oppia nitens]XP_054165623.1 uncharacterized protein LOC128963156 [Oppia nitens]